MLLPGRLHRLKLFPRLLIRHLQTGPLAPALRALLASLLAYFLAFSYCSHAFWRDPHSAFFRSERVYDLHYSLLQRSRAQEFLGAANTTIEDADATGAGGAGGKRTFKLAGAEPVLCAAFVTVARETNYFAEAVGSMLEGLTDQEREQLYLFVLFADTQPDKHPSWQEPWLRRVVDAAEPYKVSDADLARVREAEEKRNYYVKGVFDYKYTLQRCMTTSAPYIAIFEDDIIFARHWLRRTLYALTTLSTTPPPLVRSILPSDAHTPLSWLYLRLFYTETSLMWQPTDFWYAHLSLALLLTSTLGLASLLILRRLLPQTRPHLDAPALAVLAALAFPAFTALLYMIGPYSLRPLRGVVKMNRYGCCTQGLVFPRDAVPPLLRYLEERGHGQTDSLIEEFADRDGWDRFAVAPQVLQHVGLVSSRGNEVVNARSTWAFGFEAWGEVWERLW